MIFDIPAWVPSAGDGLPQSDGHAFTLPADGLYVPAGLEAVFEYNGLFMNIGRNTDRYKITSIDWADADVRDAREVNTEDDGEIPYRAYMGGRTITITGQIKTFTLNKLRAMQQSLRAAFADVSVEYPLRMRLGDFKKDHFIMCKKIQSLSGTEQQNDRTFTRDFQITLRASNPRFKSYYQNFEFVEATPQDNLTPLATIVNSGNYWAEPHIRVYGPTKQVTFLNDTTGKQFTLRGIPPATYYEFNVERKELVDAYGNKVWRSMAEGFDYLKLQGKGFPITTSATNPTGENHLFYSGDPERVEIYWHDSWI